MTAERRKGAINESVPRLWWSVREFAATAGLNYETALREIHKGTFAARKFGGEYRIPDAELQRVINEAMDAAAKTRAALAESAA
jgi:excisionase family DNA binding protein